MDFSALLVGFNLNNQEFVLVIEVTYRIAEKFGENFNLAVWRIVKKCQIELSSIIMRTINEHIASV